MRRSLSGFARTLWRATAFWLGAVIFFALCASAQDDVPAQASAPVVPLDDLLKLPPSAPTDAEIERKGGDTKPQWQARFRSARKGVTAADEELQEVRDELEELSGESGSWKMSAPGLGSVEDPTDAPSNYRLSRALKSKREEASRARQALRDLEVEANLAGVPESWRRSALEAP